MVNNHYRWDFIGLSTDTKPTPATSLKVVDGSTFYCSDTSKLYVFCQGNWYERKALGEGGGGGGGSDFTTLTNADANYTDANQTDWIAVWELATGAYKLDESATINLALTAEDDYVVQSIGASQMPFLLVDNDGDYVRASIWCNDATYLGEVEISSANGSFKPFITGVENFLGTDGEDDGDAGLVPAPTTSDVGKFLSANGSWDNDHTFETFTFTLLDGTTVTKSIAIRAGGA